MKSSSSAKLHDVVIHAVDFLAGEAEQRTVEIHVLAPGKFRVETDAKLDERHKLAIDGDGALFRYINAGNQFQQRRLATAVTPDDTEEIALLDFKGNVAQNMLLLVSLDSLGPVDDGLLDAARLFRRRRNIFAT